MQRLARFAIPLLLLASPSIIAGTAAAQEPGTGDAFVRVSVEGTKVRNLADTKGVVIAELERGTLLRVDPKPQTGWLLCEEPGGFPVWVFGKFLTATTRPNIYEVTRNAVNMRPGPSSEMANFPLPQRLHAGDRVSLIETLDPKAPMAETWVRVWSPPGVRAWVRAEDTEALEAGVDGTTRWNAGLAAVSDRVAPSYMGTGAETAKEKEDKPSAATELERVRGVLAAEAKKDSPDFGRVRGLVEAVLRENPDGQTAMEAGETLHRIEALEEAARLRQELLEERERRARRAAESQREIWEEAHRKDPLGDVFLARGVLFRRQGTDGGTRYLLRFGGETVGELECSSTRYDLDRFTGLEIGVQGLEVAATSGSSGPGSAGAARRIDVSRLEILKLR